MEKNGNFPQNHKIVITNLTNQEVVCYSLFLLKGHVVSLSSSLVENSIILHNFNSLSTAPADTSWPVVDSNFKCLLSLEHGLNKFSLEYSKNMLEFSIEFIPRSTLLCVTPVYIVCEEHDGRFQAPETEDNSIDSACERICTGLRLIQSLIAEKLYEAGYGRKTFQLENDIDRSVTECNVFYSKLSVEKAWNMPAGDLWEYFARELMTSPLSSEHRKFVAFISCTQYMGNTKNSLLSYEEIVKLTKGHVALGGGGLAVFGSACLHTWPCTTEEIIPRFLCNTPVDTSRFMDDSCYRGTYGRCFSTTLGSVCHEVGHIFDLGHTSDGIMGRGFNDFHLVFTTQKKEVNAIARKSMDESLKSCPQKDGNIFWSKSCAAILAFHRWMNSVPLEKEKHQLSFDPIRYRLSSTAGIRVIELRLANGDVQTFWEFLEPDGKLEFFVPEDLRVSPDMTIVAEDSIGNIIKCDLQPT